MVGFQPLPAISHNDQNPATILSIVKHVTYVRVDYTNRCRGIFRAAHWLQ